MQHTAFVVATGDGARARCGALRVLMLVTDHPLQATLILTIDPLRTGAAGALWSLIKTRFKGGRPLAGP
jgi:hypothetical protein